jgi:G3E family GTPase
MIPVTILTGFLGAGKTTLLKRVLSESHGQKIAVIENEFGQESIDNELLFADQQERIVEMNNGCLCCTVRGDLVDMLGRLAQRREAGEISFDRVVIETTGLAEPGPVAQTFFVDDAVAEQYLIDAVITVVDAVHGPTQLSTHPEAQAQVGFADRLLVSKSDLVSAEALSDLRRRLVAMNPRAPIAMVHFGEVDIAEVFDIRGFNLNSALEIDPDFLDTDKHHHHADDVASFLFKADRPFLAQRQRPSDDFSRGPHADGGRQRPALEALREAAESHRVHRPQPAEGYNRKRSHPVSCLRLRWHDPV